MSYIDVRRDLDLGRMFWETEQNGYLFKNHMKRMSLPILRAKNKDDIGIRLEQMRFRKLDKHTGEVEPKWRTRWFTEKTKNKMRDVDIRTCHWRLIPLAIVSGKQSIERVNLKVLYFMHIKQIVEPTQAELKEKPLAKGCEADYYAQIETNLDGAIIRRHYYTGRPHSRLPYRFAFPKRYVKTMNRYLVNNHRKDLWQGKDCFTWVRTEEGCAWYLADRGENKDPFYTDRLVGMLNSQSGDAAAVLLAYTCFAVLKDFFPQYRVLDENTPYPIVRKHMKTQFAFNLCSTSRDTAEDLAVFFCKPFQDAEWPKTTTAGVQVQSGRKESRYPALSVRKFEKKILQPASVLWINRDPADELIREGRIITLQVPGHIEKNAKDSIGMDLVCNLTRAAHNMVEVRLEPYWEACWQSSMPIVIETKKTVLSCVERSHYPIGDFDLEQSIDELLNSEDPLSPFDVLDRVRSMKTELCNDIDECMSDAVREMPDIEELKSIVIAEFSRCHRRIRKVTQKLKPQFLSLGPEYDTLLKKMANEAEPYHVNQQLLENITYLLAAAHVYIRNCIPPRDQAGVSLRVDSALKKLYLPNQIPDAKKLTERYIVALLRADRYARVRGKGSGRREVGVWYDPRTDEFYLPANTFFEDMLQTLGLTVYPKRWTLENDLLRDGILRVQEGGRRTWQVIVVRGGKRQSVLKLHPEKFFERYATDMAVRSARSAMAEDISAFH